MSLTLAVDYVEFDDGTTWGKDTQRSVEYLSGQREGEKAALNSIQDMREKQGDTVIEELLKKKESEVAAPPAGHSAEWEYGFRTGHNALLLRLREADRKGGARALASELQREVEDLERGKRK